MSDVHDDSIRPFLTVDELRGVRINPVKKDGLDPVGVAELVARAALTMETLLSFIDQMHRERADMLADAQAQSQLQQSPSSQAARMLEAAAATADTIVEQAKTDAAEILTQQRQDSDRIAAEIDSLRRTFTAMREEVSRSRDFVMNHLGGVFAQVDEMFATTAPAQPEVATEAATEAREQTDVPEAEVEPVSHDSSEEVSLEQTSDARSPEAPEADESEPEEMISAPSASDEPQPVSPFGSAAPSSPQPFVAPAQPFSMFTGQPEDQSGPTTPFGH